MASSSQPQHFFGAGCIFADFAIAVFLAAMSSSRSDVVTQSVLPFFRPFFLFCVLEVFSRPKEFQWGFKAV